MLTKEQRNQIYTAALPVMTEELTARSRAGLCYALDDVVRSVAIDVSPYAELSKDLEVTEFPEIVKHRPKNLATSEYWFLKDEEGIWKRIKILKQAIEETK